MSDFDEDVTNNNIIENDPVIQEAKQSLGNKAKQTINKLITNLLKVIGKGLLFLLKVLLPYILVVIVILIISIVSYYIIYEFTGTEKEYNKKYENELVYNKDNVAVATEDSMVFQNKIIKDFYCYFSGQSFWQIIGDDNSVLISSDDENAIKDYYKREDVFKLNSNFLFSLDNFLYMNEGDWKYPEQTIKPVYYDEDDLTLKQLTDKEGFVIVKSEEEDIKTGEKTGNEIFSVRDYGLASILKYNEEENWQRTLKIRGTYISEDRWDSETESVITVDIEEEFELIMDNYPEDINLIDKVVSFTGEIEYIYEYKEKKFNDLIPGQTSKENEPKTEFLYKIHKEPIYDTYQDELGITRTEIVDYDEYELYKYRSDDSAIIEDLPVVVNTIVKDRGDEYLQNYLYNFESYVPIDAINNFELIDRIDYDSYVFDYEAILTDDYGFNLGSGINKNPNKFNKAYQYFDIIEAEASYFGVDPYIMLAIMTQESGGNPYINKDGIMQICYGDRTVTSTNIYGESVTITITDSEKSDVEKSVRWATAYFKNLLDIMEGNPYKAIQAYNLGEGTLFSIKNNYPEAWNSEFGWLIYREWARRKQWSNSRSASYGCMAFPEGELMSGQIIGDSCYLENVLQWYVGDDMDKINLNIGNIVSNIWNRLRETANDIYKFFIKEREEDELVPKIDFINHAKYNKVSDILKTVYSLDNTALFSESSEDYGDLSFWDEGFMQAMANIGLSLQEILEIAPNPEGYLPPINMQQDNVTITSYFGLRIDPIDKVTQKFHTGVDVAAVQGTPIYAVASGEVVMAKSNGSGGNEVRIDHGNGVETRYKHLYQFAVKKGDYVYQGEPIGTVGTTGRSTGPHLHFEILKNNTNLDPLGIIVGE